jgi:trans-2,3-dihydro-3-hydroxyanthranilate isomerase
MENDRIELMLIDAFTDEAFSGSPVGVVCDADRLNDEQMQKVASELVVPATAFVVGRKDESVKMRFFTLSTQVEIDGQAALAAVSALAWDGKLGSTDESSTIVLDTLAGNFSVEIGPHPICGVEVGLTFDDIGFEPFGYSHDLLAGALGMSRQLIPDHWPLSIVRAGAGALAVPVSTIEGLDAARPDHEALLQLSAKIDVSRIMLYSWQGPVDLYCRGFAPAIGVPEEPVSACGLAAVAALVVRERALQLSPPLSRLTAEQGLLLGRRGQAKIEVAHKDREVGSLRIRGTAVKTMDGRLLRP